MARGGLEEDRIYSLVQYSERIHFSPRATGPCKPKGCGAVRKSEEGVGEGDF